jgi:AcrR family transcriptional regulator
MRVRTEERREAIIETAAQLFAEVGYDEASMSELAKRLGGSKGTLYGYFESKESVLIAVVEWFARGRLADAVAELSPERAGQRPLNETLTRFGEEILKDMANDKSTVAVHRMILAEARRSNIGELFYDSGPRQCIEALAALLGGAIDSGELRAAKPQVLALQFVSLLTAEISERQYQQQHTALALKEIDQMVSHAVEMFLRGAAFHKP